VILKEAMRPLLPPEILTRIKWGFGPPIHAWMNNGLLPVVRKAYRASEAVRHGLLDPAGVGEQLARAGSAVPGFQTAQKLWALLVLEIWCRVFLNGNATRPPKATLRDLV
jgi:asparagine synthase (glutamine-hydrolysing)